MPGPSAWFILAQWGRGPSVKEADSTFPLTNELQCQDTVWHCPLDVVVIGGCVVIPSKKVGLGEGRLYHCTPFSLSLLPSPTPPHPLVVYGLQVLIFLLAFQACATMPDFFIYPCLCKAPVFLPLSSLLVLPMRWACWCRPRTLACERLKPARAGVCSRLGYTVRPISIKQINPTNGGISTSARSGLLRALEGHFHA